MGHHIGNNCIVIGNNCTTNENDCCVLIGDNLEADEPYTFRVSTGKVDIGFTMGKIIGYILVDVIRSMIRNHYQLPPTSLTFLHITNETIKQKPERASYCGGCGFTHAPDRDCPKGGGPWNEGL